MDKKRVALSFFVAHLPDGFHKRQRFDVAHRAADFHDNHVGVAGNGPHRVLYLVGNVRDNLNRLAQIIAAPLFVNHRLINAPARPIVFLGQLRVGKTLVVAQIQVGFRAVVSHENFPVLERRHRARVNVDIRVELDERHAQAPHLQQTPNRRRRQPLAKTGNNAACHKNIFRHNYYFVRKPREISHR